MNNLHTCRIGLGLVLACVNFAGGASFAADISPFNKQSEEGVALQINAAHSGSLTFASGFSAPLTQLWTYTAGGSLSYPLVAGGRVYVVANGDDLFALNAATGAKVWEHLLGGGSNLGAYDRGTLFFDDSAGQLTALRAVSGRQLWSVQVASDSSASAPIAVDGQVFVAGPALTAVNETTGAINWSQGIEATDGAPAYGGGGLYVGGPCQYYAFAPSNGATIWHDNGNCFGGGGSSPAYFDGRDYLMDWSQGNFVLNAKTGVDNGSFAGNTTPTFFTGSNKRGYALEYQNGQLYCIDVKTGNVAWSFANNQLVGQPIVINGQPIVGASTGDIFMLNGSNGTQIWTANVGTYVTALSAGDGVLAVAAGNTVTVFAPQ